MACCDTPGDERKLVGPVRKQCHLSIRVGALRAPGMRAVLTGAQVVACELVRITAADAADSDRLACRCPSGLFVPPVLYGAAPDQPLQRNPGRAAAVLLAIAHGSYKRRIRARGAVPIRFVGASFSELRKQSMGGCHLTNSVGTDKIVLVALDKGAQEPRGNQ